MNSRTVKVEEFDELRQSDAREVTAVLVDEKGEQINLTMDAQVAANLGVTLIKALQDLGYVPKPLDL